METFKCRDVCGQEHYGLMTLEDFAAFHARIEQPVTTDYRGFTDRSITSADLGPKGL